jgi:Fe-Mn family superoxide dismutase|tara:strand:+ start:7635 stop:8246 length:612 start_codon:yes stop_codon:yes gene_type:complete
MVFELPELDYEYDSLEPFIDKETMEIHHSKHHQTYVNNLNKALEGHEELQGKPVEELLKSIDSISEQIRTAVKNHGGGYFNHSFFWKCLKKDVEPQGEVLEAIKRDFESYEVFVEKFKQAAVTQFGSGWAWLVLNLESKKLEIMQTHDQESPISLGKIPLLVVDVWEHAYYLKYQNKRPEYVDAFMNIINWDEVNKNYLKATQ